MTLRIAFCGSSGTGKTTLARAVSKKFNLPQCPIGSREVAKQMGFASPYDVDAAGQRAEFQERLVLSKTEWEAANENFVTDRTTIDNMIYSMLHGAVERGGAELLAEALDISSDSPPRDYTLRYVRRALQGFRRYTHIFFCPMICFFNPGSDPARVSDPDYHRLFEELLVQNLRAFAAEATRPQIWIAGIGVYGDAEKRQQEVYRLIGLTGLHGE